jgi:hypothetical protein
MVVLQFKPGTSTFQLLAWGTVPAPTRHSHVTTGLHSSNAENTVQVIKTMYQTGLDIQARATVKPLYEGGLRPELQ